MYIPIKNKNQVNVKNKSYLFVDSEDFKLKLKTLNNLIVYNSEEIILEIPDDQENNSSSSGSSGGSENVVYNHLLSFSNGNPNGAKGYGIYYLKSESSNQKIYSRLDDEFTLTFNLPVSVDNLPILKNKTGEEINYIAGSALEDDGYFYEFDDFNLENTNELNLIMASDNAPVWRNFIFASTDVMNTTCVPSLPAIIKISNSEYEDVNNIFMTCGRDENNGYSYFYTNKDGSVHILIVTDSWIDETGEYCTDVIIRRNDEAILYKIVPVRTRFTDDGDPDPTLDDLNNATNSEYFVGEPGLIFSKYE